MFLGRIRRSGLIMVAATATLCSTLCPSSYNNNDTKERVENIIEESLQRDSRNVYQIPSSLSYKYESALSEASSYIDDFLDEMKSIVLRSELDNYVDKAIKKRLREYNLTRSEIPYSIESKFNKKRKSIISRLKDLSMYNNYEYVTKSDVKDVVQQKISYSFISDIKTEKGSSWGLGSAIVGGIASGIANIIGSMGSGSSSSDNSADNYSSGSSGNTTSNIPVYYSDKCTICQSDFYGAERVGVLNCGHCFHPECIKQALEYDKRCPNCRHSDAYLHSIYDSKEQVPGYTPEPSAPSYDPPYNPEIYEPEPSAPASDYVIIKHDECSICLDDFDGAHETHRIAVLSCGHMFHEDCIQSWFAQSNTCPYCMTENVIIRSIYNNKYEMPV